LAGCDAVVHAAGINRELGAQTFDRVHRRGTANECPSSRAAATPSPISHTEFQFAAREYPIVFTSGDEGKSFAPVAVLGIAAGENLFVANAAWARGVYVPAYARRYPFCMAKVTLDQVEQKDRLICIEKAFIDEQGEPMFDANGQPSAKWSDIERLLSNTRSISSAAGRCAPFSATTGCSSPSPCRRRSTRKRAAARCTSPACTG